MAAATDQERVLLEACSLSAEDCFVRMGSREKGLSAEEVEEKRREFGTNEVSTKQGGLLLRTYHRFANPLVIQLLIIAGVSFIMGDLRSFIVVAGMVLISVGLSSFQEERSGTFGGKTPGNGPHHGERHAGREGIGDPAGARSSRGRRRAGCRARWFRRTCASPPRRTSS